MCPTTELQRIFLTNLRLPQPTGRYNTNARLETPCACQPRALAPRPRWQRSSFRKDLHAAQPLNRGPEDGTSAPRPPQHRRSLFLKTRRPVHPPAHTGRKASESLTLIPEDRNAADVALDRASLQILGRRASADPSRLRAPTPASAHLTWQYPPPGQRRQAACISPTNPESPAPYVRFQSSPVHSTSLNWIINPVD